MNQEFLGALKQIEKERNIPLDKLLPFIEDALVASLGKPLRPFPHNVAPVRYEAEQPAA